MSPFQTTTIDQSREMTQNFELSSHLNFTLAKVSQLLQVDSSLIWRFKYDSKAMLNQSKNSRNTQNLAQGEAELVAHWLKDAEVDNNLPKYSFNLTDSPLCQKAWQNAEYKQKPLVINKKNDLLKITDLEDPCLVFQVESRIPMLMIPMIGNQSSTSLPKVLGFLVFHQNQPRVWHSSEIDLAHWAAMNASLAIIHHETLGVVQSLSDERQVQSRFASELQTMLFQKRGETIEELRRNNEIKDQFIARLSDELKNPLTIMKMAINNLKNNGADQQKAELALNILDTQCTKEIELVNELLSLQKLQTNQVQLQIQKVDLKPMLDFLASFFTDKWASKGLIYTREYHNSFRPKFSIPIATDYEKIKEIVTEILQNAGKFAKAHSQVEIKVSELVKDQQKYIKIEVKNLGAGITPEEQKHIFDAFFQGSNVPHASNRGMGIGLTKVKYLVELLKGTVEVTSLPLADTAVSETCFTLTLPQSQ